MSRTSKTPLDRRNEFIQAARVLFNEKGFENTSIDDIVARVGVAKGLFYYYFDSKEKILDILFARLQDEIESAIAGAMEKKGLNAIERFNELMAAKREVACRSATLLAYFRQDRNKAVQFTMEKRALNAMAGAMEEIIRQGVQEGAVRDRSPPPYCHRHPVHGPRPQPSAPRGPDQGGLAGALSGDPGPHREAAGHAARDPGVQR